MQQRTIGRYRVLEEIASGGQGTVYRAWETTTGRVVALKVLHPHLSSDAGVLERFRREAQLAAAVTHPNITQIFEVGRDGDYHFISMEYLPLSIQNLIESQGALPIDRAADICYQTARALEAASGRGIIHRDIKPQNLLLSPDGVVKVTDFGIARATSLSTMTRTGAVMGTPHYMSPEQARGQRVDTRSDLYSLGIVLYQMLTGRIPFEAETPWEVIRQHIEVKAEPVRRVRSEVPRPLERLVERCLEKRPDRRYQSAGELASALREAVPGTGGGRRQQSPVAPAPAQRPATSPAARAASTPSRAAQPERIRPSETWMSSWARAWSRTHRNRWAWVGTVLSLAIALSVAGARLDAVGWMTGLMEGPGEPEVVVAGQPTTAPQPPATAAPPAEPEPTTAAPPTVPTLTATPEVVVAGQPTTVAPQPTAAPPTVPTLTATPAPPASTAQPSVGATPMPQELRYGGELSLAVRDDPFADGFSPFESVSLAKTQINTLIFSRLFRRTASGIEPDLAEAWDVSGDGREWVIQIRQDARFHDGRPVTAYDVLYSVEAFLTRGVPPNPVIESMFKIDDFTIGGRFRREFRRLPSQLVHDQAIIVQLGMLEEEVSLGKLVGSGPFVPIEYDRGGHLLMKRNPDYYETGRPYVDRIRILFVHDRATMLADFGSGQLDFLDVAYTHGLPRLTQKELETIPPDDSNIVSVPLQSTFAVWFDTQSAPFDDVRIRRAIWLAIDQPLVNRVVWEGQGELQNPVPQAIFPYWAGQPNELWHKYDPDRARQLLAEAGYPDGFDTVLVIPDRDWVILGEIIANMLGQVGINVNLVILEPRDFAEAAVHAYEGIVIAPLQRFGGDIDSFLHAHFAEGGSHNYGRLSSQLIEEVLSYWDHGDEIDQDGRRELLRVLQEQIGENALLVPLPAAPAIYVRNGRVQGPTSATDLGTMMSQVWLARPVPEPPALAEPTAVPAPTTPPESTAVPIGLQPLVQISNDFVGDLKPGWLLRGSAKHDPAGTVVLTEPVNDQTGALFYTGQVRVERFEAVFKFEIGEGSGADGLQFVIRQVHPTVGGPGLNEFEIDFDTFMNDDDPSDNNVGFVEPGKRKITASSLGAGYSLRNSGVFEATVAFDNGNVEVYLNNPTIGLRPELIIEHTIPNFVPFDGYFGFKAWTSGSNDRHVLHEVSFTQLDVEQAAVSYEFPTEPLRGDRVFLNSGTLNGQQITSSNPFLSVTPGQAISGTVNLMVANDHGGHAVFPVEATPTWGDHQSGYWAVPISVPSYGTARRDVTIDLTAPSTPGVYAIIFAAQAEFTGGYITSATHWPSGSPQWNNDDDIAGWSASQIDFAIANGYLRAHQHGSGVDFAHFGAAAVKIIVP